MKTQPASFLYLFLLLLALSYSLLGARTPFIREGHWCGTIGPEKEGLRLELDVRGTHASNAKIYLLRGTERTEITEFTQRNDSLFISLQAEQGLIQAKIDDEQLTGLYKTLTAPMATGVTFRAEHGRRHADRSEHLAQF